MQKFLKLFLAVFFFFFVCVWRIFKKHEPEFVVAEVMIKFVLYTIVEERQGIA